MDQSRAARFVASGITRGGQIDDIEAADIAAASRFSTVFAVEDINLSRFGRRPPAAGCMIGNIISDQPDAANRPVPAPCISCLCEPSDHQGVAHLAFLISLRTRDLRFSTSNIRPAALDVLSTAR